MGLREDFPPISAQSFIYSRSAREEFSIHHQCMDARSVAWHELGELKIIALAPLFYPR